MSTQALGRDDGSHYSKGKDFGRRPQLKVAPRGRHQIQFKPNQRDLLWSFSFFSICNSHLKGRGNISGTESQEPHGTWLRGDRKIYVDLEEALGYIFGCFRKGFGPLKFFFLPSFPPLDCWDRHQRRQQEERKRRWESRQKELIRPVVLIKLRGIIFRVTVLHSNSTRQDGGHIVAHNIPLLLFLLLLHLAQLKAWWGAGGKEGFRM